MNDWQHVRRDVRWIIAAQLIDWALRVMPHGPARSYLIEAFVTHLRMAGAEMEDAA